MKKYSEMTKAELSALCTELRARYEEEKSKGLSLDMSRGKPAADQLDLSMGILNAVTSDDIIKTANGFDCRNYGILDGIPEAKKLMADLMGTTPEHVVVGGNSSLNMMFDALSRGMIDGFGGSKPLMLQENRKWLCPVPGYDRHFSITEHFGFEMIPIPLHEDGPDMDLVEKYVNGDETVKGIWCIPKYSNPSGIVYSDETIRRMAALRPAAKDFRIFWDNAYVLHHLYEDDQAEILDILSECEKAGNPDMVFEVASTSKVTFPGSGIAAFASSEANIKEMKGIMTWQTIGPDKINQLRHVKYFGNIDNMKAHMMKQAALLRPKFEAVEAVLERELGELGICTWTKPKGGYFISFNALDGCAKAIVEKCKEAGVTLTGAGATYPYKKDPHDSNIRIAPSYPTAEELAMTADLFVLCVKLVSAEKLLAQ